jgi:hypothetical protein
MEADFLSDTQTDDDSYSEADFQTDKYSYRETDFQTDASPYTATDTSRSLRGEVH